MFSKIKQWHKDPLVIPRWLLTAKYIAFAVLGFLVLLGGLPTLDLLTFSGYTVVWSLTMMAASLWGAYYSLNEQGEPRERWGSLIVFALLFTWAVAAIVRAVVEGDLGRISGSFSVMVISMLPGVRAFDLLRKTGM